ncbi:MAG TPA: Type 1 glutamine amidotransferase-like domain-containing protein [Thermoanaerobaculia bacterium]|jgi:cyanophycinase-like exopeptidase
MTQPLHVQLATPVTLLVLIGGGEFSFGETREIDEFLVRRMPPDRKTIAFLPTASASVEYAVYLGKYFKKIDPQIETNNVPIYRGRDSRRQKNLNHLLAAGMIYVGGGVTNDLLATLRESPAEMALRDAAANGAVIAAIGAGAASFGTQTRDMRSSASALPALGWLQNTVVETGFDPQDDTMLRRLMSIPDVRAGIGIPPGTAVAIESGGTTSVLGSGNIAVFRKP